MLFFFPRFKHNCCKSTFKMLISMKNLPVVSVLCNLKNSILKKGILTEVQAQRKITRKDKLRQGGRGEVYNALKLYRKMYFYQQCSSVQPVVISTSSHAAVISLPVTILGFALLIPAQLH